MNIFPLPLSSDLEQYQQQADDLYKAYASGDKAAIRFIKYGHPEWWKLSEAEYRELTVTPADAQDVIAWFYSFNGWSDLAAWVEVVKQSGSPAAQFEATVDAIVGGDIPTLRSLLHSNPALISARSLRSHHSTLLHYTGTNGVEGYRQKYPANAIEVLKLLLNAGAEVEAKADMYGGGSTTLGLLATSIHPAKAGIMATMLQILLDAGAVIDQPSAAGNGQYAINGCLHNGRPEAADFLMRHGALLDLEGAAGTGRLDIVKQFFEEDGSLKITATQKQLEYGFIWACEFGHTAVVDFLISKGLDPNVEVDGMYGLHWALIGGHRDLITRLIQHPVSLEARNRYGGNAIGSAMWALCNSDGVYRWPEMEVDYWAIIEELLKAGAPIERGMLSWLAQESDIPSPIKERLDTLFRQYGASS
jgi:hypothetical protein